MCNIRIGIAGYLLFAWTMIYGQGSNTLGTLPNVNLGIPLASTWKLNGKIESRQILRRGNSNGSETRFEFKLLDIGAIVSKKIGSRNTLGAGYLIRLEENRTGHRLMQQFAFGRSYGVVAIAHRLSADQTFRASELPEYRLRYRIGMEIPLNGQSVDPRELYLKLTNEYLGIQQGSDTDLEIRILGVLGIFFHEKSKFEAGLEYRTNGFLQDAANKHLWMNIGYFLTI